MIKPRASGPTTISTCVSFKDITTIMDNGEAYGYATDKIVEYAKDRDVFGQS